MCGSPLVLVKIRSAHFIETLDFITKSSVLESASFLTSDQTRTLAEFKHIIKRRKRN